MNIGYILYNKLLNNDYHNIKQIINNINIYNCDSGILSNILSYYILIKDDIKIQEFLELKLKKRDYFNIMVYDKKYLYLFDYILENFELLDKDLDFIIENKLNVLDKLDGYFLKTKYNIYNVDHNNLKLYYLKENEIKYSLNLLKTKIKLFKINDYNKNYNHIIDGGNVINSELNYNNLNIINKLSGETLLIIHSKHKKFITQLNLNCDIFYTPYKIYDDLYILYFFLLLGTKPFIISNDKYRDNINNLKLTNNFKNIIKQQTLTFNIKKQYIDKYPKYSNCIQKINNIYFIPSLNSLT